MRKLLSSVSLGLLLVSSALASFTDDPELHATFVGQKRHNHEAKVVQNIPEGTLVYYDKRKPADRQLIVRPQGRLLQYTCPAVPGVPGLEKPRPMGLCPEFKANGNATKVEVLRAAYDDQDIHPLTGLYHSLGVVRLKSVVENSNRVNTLRMLCRSGQDDGMPLTIDFKETYHELIQTWDASKVETPVTGFIHSVKQPKGADLPACFTFSCWYKNTGQGTNLDVKTLMELRLTATEALIKDQTKVLRFGVGTDTGHPGQLYVALQGSKESKRVVKVKTGTKSVLKTAAVPEEFEMKSEPVYRTITIGGVQRTIQDYDVKDTPVTLDNGTKKWYWKNVKYGTVWLNGHQLVLIGGNKGSFFYRDVTPKTKQVKKVLKKAVPAVYKQEDVFEDKTIHELKTIALVDSWVTLDGWMNFVMHVDAATELATVYCNGAKIVSGKTNFKYSLNGPFSWSIGARQPALLGEVLLVQGQLVPPSAFCARNSQNQVVPVKFEGPYGPNGCSLPRREGNPAPAAAKAPPAKEPTQPAAAKAPPATQQAAKAPAPAPAKGAAKAPAKAPGAPKQAPKAPNKVAPVKVKK